MRKRPLGKTGIEVSELAFGGVEIGMPYGIGIKTKNDMPQEKEAIYLLHKSQEQGINFFDTARMYGHSERIIGKAFSDRRNKIILSTKCRHLREEKGQIPPDAELLKRIHSSINESLYDLQTEYLDVFMLHQADIGILENDKIAEAFLGLKESGKVRAIGVSTYSLEESETAINQGFWEIVQLPFNLLDQRQATLFDKASQEGIGLMVRSVLLKGLLSERGKNLPGPLKKVEQHIQKYDELLKGSGWNLPTLAIKFALSFDQVSSVLVGIDKEKYLHDALQAGDGNYLKEEDLLTAKGLEFPDPEFINLHHWSKMGWLP